MAEPASALEQLIRRFARLPGLGPRSARRAVLFLLQRREEELAHFVQALTKAQASIVRCERCGQLETQSPCRICADSERDASLLCVVEQQSDLWALERAGAYRGHYHVLGGTLSALDGVGPEQLHLASLAARCKSQSVREVILAMGATVQGQATAHYVTELLRPLGVKLTRLAHGVPIGGELDYMDNGTLAMALKARTRFDDGA